ncbi:MAG: peptide deformylase [Proteobacteria bacterium]|nr:peptide deformylase [Pseudomonadota bacterium]
MTILAVLQEPDPRLRKPSQRIDLIDAEVRRLAHDMLDTMYHLGGCGLAAPQVNTRRRVIVVDTSASGDAPLILVNPVLHHHGDRMARFEEGCLSIPDLYVAVRRPAEICVHALDLDSNPTAWEGGGWAAAVIQHEIDHLDGRLLTDALSPKDKMRHSMRQQRRHR